MQPSASDEHPGPPADRELADLVVAGHDFVPRRSPPPLPRSVIRRRQSEIYSPSSAQPTQRSRNRRQTVELPAYSPHAAALRSIPTPGEASSGATGSGRAQELVEHTYTLDSSDEQPWLSLKVRSRAGKPENPPIYLEGDAIQGEVSMDLGKADSIKAVILSVSTLCLPSTVLRQASISSTGQGDRGGVWPRHNDIPRLDADALAQVDGRSATPRSRPAEAHRETERPVQVALFDCTAAGGHPGYEADQSIRLAYRRAITP